MSDAERTVTAAELIERYRNGEREFVDLDLEDDLDFAGFRCHPGWSSLRWVECLRIYFQTWRLTAPMRMPVRRTERCSRVGVGGFSHGKLVASNG